MRTPDAEHSSYGGSAFPTLEGDWTKRLERLPDGIGGNGTQPIHRYMTASGTERAGVHAAQVRRAYSKYLHHIPAIEFMYIRFTVSLKSKIDHRPRSTVRILASVVELTAFST